MGLFGELPKAWNRYLFNQGARSQAEYLVKSLPESHRSQAYNYLSTLNSLDVVADPNLFYKGRE